MPRSRSGDSGSERFPWKRHESKSRWRSYLNHRSAFPPLRRWWSVNSMQQLPRLYNEILNHPNTSDDLRRETESKLLRMKQTHLFSIPADSKNKDKKARLAAEVEELINGIVLLKIPDELAWTLLTESKDAERIGNPPIEHFMMVYLNVSQRTMTSTCYEAS